MIKDDGSGVAGGLVKVVAVPNLCLDMAGDKPGERNGGRLRLLFDMFNEVLFWDILMKFCFQCFGTIDEALRFKIEGAFTGRLGQLKGRMVNGAVWLWKVVAAIGGVVDLKECFISLVRGLIEHKTRASGSVLKLNNSK